MSITFQKELRQLALLPFSSCAPEIELEIGAIGLSMNGVAYDLYAKDAELKHTDEYINSGRVEDVIETIQEYEWKLEYTRLLLRNKRDRLLLLENGKDTQVIRAVAGFLLRFVERLGRLTQIGDQIVNQGIKEDELSQYKKVLNELSVAANEYIKLHIGYSGEVINNDESEV